MYFKKLFQYIYKLISYIIHDYNNKELYLNSIELLKKIK